MTRNTIKDLISDMVAIGAVMAIAKHEAESLLLRTTKSDDDQRVERIIREHLTAIQRISGNMFTRIGESK